MRSRPGLARVRRQNVRGCHDLGCRERGLAYQWAHLLLIAAGGILQEAFDLQGFRHERLEIVEGAAARVVVALF